MINARLQMKTDTPMINPPSMLREYSDGAVRESVIRQTKAPAVFPSMPFIHL
jgi:hypothetical protein